MSRKVILGLSLKGPYKVPTSDGSGKVHLPAIGWALIQKQNNNMEKKINISEIETIEIARKKVGEYLKKIRTDRKLSYYNVSENSGLTIGQIQSIENGEKAYTIDSFFRITRALNCYLLLEHRDHGHLDDEGLSKAIGDL